MSRVIARSGKVWFEETPGTGVVEMSCGLVTVLLDGEECKLAVYADEEKGEVEVIVEGPGSRATFPNFIPDPFSRSGLKSETRHGDVTIRLDETAAAILRGEQPRNTFRA